MQGLLGAHCEVPLCGSKQVTATPPKELENELSNEDLTPQDVTYDPSYKTRNLHCYIRVNAEFGPRCAT